MALGVVIPNARLTVIDANGAPLSGAKMQCWLAGTTTPQALYADDALSIPLSNPVIADGNGIFPAMFVGPVAVKLELRTSADVVVWQADDITPANLLTGLMNSAEETGHYIGAPVLTPGIAGFAVQGTIVVGVSQTFVRSVFIGQTVDATSQPSLSSVLGLLVSPTVSIGASGTPVIASGYFLSPAISTGGATPSEATTLIVDGAPSVGTLRYGMKVTDAVKFGKALVLEAELTPPALAANADNYAPTGIDTAYYLRISASAPVNLTGIASMGANGPSTTANVQGRQFQIRNVGAQTITLTNDATSTAANRFLLPGGSSFSLTAGLGITIRYDFTSLRWVIV